MENSVGTTANMPRVSKFRVLSVVLAAFSALVCLGDGTPQDGDVLLYLPFDNSMETVASVSENVGGTTSGTLAYDSDDIWKMHVVERGDPLALARQGANAAALKANKVRITRTITHPYMLSSDFNCATIEFFMKGSSTADEVTTWGNKLSLGSGSRCGLMVQANDSKKYYVKIQTDTSETVSTSPFYMTDGKWHHFAIIVEPVSNGTQTKITWHFDYTNKVEATKDGVWVGFQNNHSLTFGQTDNVFLFDELRITKGAISPKKFMRFVTNPNPQDGDTLYYMPLDDDMDSVAEFYGDDIGGDDTTTGTPVYDADVWKEQVVEYGDPCALVRQDRNVGCLKAERMKIVRNFVNPFMTASNVLESATIEFFMKGSGVPGEVADWENKLSLGNDNSKCGLMIQASNQTNYYLRVDTDSGKADVYSSVSMRDGKWHHFAIVIDPVNDGAQTQVTYYFDYGDPVVKTADGRWCGLRYNQKLTFGAAKSVLYLDEFRVSKGVVPKSKFMKAKAPYGFMLIVR